MRQGANPRPVTQQVTRSPATAFGGEGDRRGTQTGKEEVTLSLLADDMALYTENPTTPPETANTRSEVAGRNTAVQKPVALQSVNKYRKGK